VTLFGIFLTPVFYSVVRWFSDRKAVEPAPVHESAAAPAGTILEPATTAVQGERPGH
jgi:hypothetical protein